jgi:hypothetical protein
MKKNTIHISILLSLGFLAGACHKQLDVYPTTSEVDGNVITDQQSAQTVLNGVYYKFANGGFDALGNPYTDWADINEAIPSQLADALTWYGYYSPITAFSFVPGTQDADSIWFYSYDVVNAANGFIKNVAPVANIAAMAKRQMLAEAKFLRAFGNSQLLLYYAQYNDTASKYGIILRDTFVTSANVNLPRSSVAAAYSSILSDLDSAIAGLPILNTAIYYANASDAKLLKARILMNRGVGTDYAQVISLTNDIISNGPFALEDSLKDIFLTKGLNSSEVMLGIQPYPNENYKFQVYISNISYLATDSLVSLLTNDARSQWVVQYAYVPEIFDSAWLLTKYYPGDPNNPVQTQVTGYCYAFRLSEAYLLEAEAITLSNGDLNAAKALLTTVMSNAGASAQAFANVANATTPAALQLEIVKENMRNFTCENGVDWLAFRRLPFATMQLMNPYIQTQNQLIFPIPPAELHENNVFQNPGY